MSRKELKAPDAFQKAGAEAREWLQERQKQVAIVAAVILLGGAGAAMASYFSGRGEDQSSKELGAALKVLERPVQEAAANTPPPEGDLAPFKSEREKDEALKKALSEFRAKHKGSTAAATAALSLGQAALRLGDADLALSSFNEYLKETPKDVVIRAAALEGQGYAYEAKGQLDQALSSFEQLARENKSEFLGGMGLYHRGRILILQNKKEEAAKAFSEVGTANPGSSAARLASERLALLAAEGIKPPPPPAAAPDAG